jgi:uncharacterized protein (TIGR02246 family)
MRIWAAMALLALISATASCQGGAAISPSPGEVRSAIEVRNAAFGEAVRAGDAAAIAQLYTPDGVALPPNAPAVTGTAELAAFWGELLGSGIADAKLTAEEVTFTSGDFATEVGAAALFAKDGAQAYAGKYLVLWKKTEAGWRMHRDIWNSNRAAPEPAAPPAEAAPSQAAP